MAAQRSQIGLKSAAGTLKSAAGENFAKNDKKSYFFLWKNRFFWPFGAFGAEGAEKFFLYHPPTDALEFSRKNFGSYKSIDAKKEKRKRRKV